MANFLFKKQNDRSYNIYYSRQLLGTVNLKDGKWSGTIHRDGVREQVVDFSTASGAFQALILALKITRLNKQGAEFISFARQGSTAAAEQSSYNVALAEYVRVFNTHNAGGAQLRVVTRRR